MTRYSIRFVFEARDELEAHAVVMAMEEAVHNRHPRVDMQADDLAYMENGNPVLRPVGDLDFYDVILDLPGDKKINLIKEVRGITYLGLKEAKDLVDASASKPQYIVRDTSRDEARRAVEALESTGARAHSERSTLTKWEIDEAKKGLLQTVETLETLPKG